MHRGIETKMHSLLKLFLPSDGEGGEAGWGDIVERLKE